MEKPVRLLLVGAAGRMGQAISRLAESRTDIEIARACGRGDSVSNCIGDCDVVVDVSAVAAAEEICVACAQRRKPLVIGTTGHSAEQTAAIARAAESIPIVLAPNFSVGVNTLFWLTRKAVELLGDEFDAEIVETHHRLKRDAPSGTAKRLAQLLCDARNLHYDRDVRHGREGLMGERSQKEIGMHAIRAGDVIGEHTVIFAGPGERLELTHRASSRDTFAVGALRAASWIVDQPAGLYNMEHVLGLESST